MPTQRHRQSLCIQRLLALLMLAMALLPGLSRAWAMSQGGDWVEICSAQGSRWVQQGGADEVDEVDDGKGFKPMAEPCDACPLQQPGLTPPPAWGWQAPVQGRAAPPPLFYLAPRPLAVWRSRLSRGPPAAA